MAPFAEQHVQPDGEKNRREILTLEAQVARLDAELLCERNISEQCSRDVARLQDSETRLRRYLIQHIMAVPASQVAVFPNHGVASHLAAITTTY